MINLRYSSTASQPPLTDERKILLEAIVQRQIQRNPREVDKQVPLEYYPIRPTTQQEVIFEVEKWPFQVFFFASALLWGLAWRFEHENLFWAACITTAITAFQYQDADWYVKVSTQGITIRTEYNGLLEIPFQQIICIYVEEQRFQNTVWKELTIYHAYHGGDYTVTRTSKLEEEVYVSMGIIHYFFNQYKNKISRP